MGLSVIPSLLEEKPLPVTTIPGAPPKPEIKKVKDVAPEGKYYRHPDSAKISYPLVVEKPLGKIQKPTDKKVKIAIVGAGPAGIAALYELCNLEDSTENIEITLYESDGYNVVNCQGVLKSLTNEPREGQRAGRYSSAILRDCKTHKDRAVYEIGAMRFPEISGLVWHYANLIYPEEEVHVFPNPGVVPAELVHGDRVDRFGPYGRFLDEDSPVKELLNVIRKRLVGSPKTDDEKTSFEKKDPNTNLFRIAGKDPARFSKLLKSKTTTENELAVLYEEWKEFARKYDDHTLESAIREIIEKSIDQLPNIKGVSNNTEKVTYYVGLFGGIGFGTGGYKTMYHTALIEMIRLLLWSYHKEYFLPTKANYEFIEKLYGKAREKNPNITVKLARVNDVAHVDGNPDGEAVIVSYPVSKLYGTESETPQSDFFNYVILASTPRQTISMISKVNFSNVGQKVTFGKHGCYLKSFDNEVRPALILSTDNETLNSKIYKALSNVNMVPSSKIYASIKKDEFEKIAPDFKWNDITFDKIKAVISDTGLGASYLVPVAHKLEKPRAGEIADEYYSFLISYAWGSDTQKLQEIFKKYSESDVNVLHEVINRTVRNVRDPEDNKIKPWWFGELLSEAKLEDPIAFDWTTTNVAGAFKMDNPGDYYNIDLLFRYHTHALKPELKNKFFLANCSYSHVGGWTEGAFMTAVNAVCGVVAAANGGKVDLLNSEAQKVLTGLDSVIDGQ